VVNVDALRVRGLIYGTPELCIVAARYDCAFAVCSELLLDVSVCADELLRELDVEAVLRRLLHCDDEY